MKTIRFYQKILLVVLLSLLGRQSYAQTILVTGTEFEVPAKANEAYASLDEIGFIGIIKPIINYNMNLTPDTEAGTFRGGTYYAVTNNPSKLAPIPGGGVVDEYYYNNNDAYWGLMLSNQQSNPNKTLLSLSASGLKPGPASVQIEACIPMRMDNGYLSVPPVNYYYSPTFKVAVNLDASNAINGTDLQLDKNNGTGSCRTLTIPTTITAAGTIYVNINAMSQTHHQLLIKSIKVYAEVNPKIVGPSEVCAGGESAILSVAASYQGNITYQWYKNGTLIPGATDKIYRHSSNTSGVASTTYYYTMTVGGNTIKSEDFVVKDILCCVNPDNTPASRKLIWKEDFGTFTSPTAYWVWDYTDIANPKKVQKTTPNQWRRQSDPAFPIPNAVYVPTGDVAEQGSQGGYAIIANIAQNVNGLNWAAKAGDGTQYTLPNYFPDHTYPDRSEYGACLMLNCSGNAPEIIYDHTINGLCDKKLTVKCFINNFSDGSNPVKIQVKVTDLASGGQTVNSPVIERYANGGSGSAWTEVSVDIDLLPGSSSIRFQIISTQLSPLGGNDLLLDDIQIYACSPPTVDLYFDLNTYNTSMESCDGNDVTLYADETLMLKHHYGAALSYLFQYTTEDPSSLTFDKKSWKNINPSPISASSLSGTDIEQIFTNFKNSLSPVNPNGEKIYFRVVAGENVKLTALMGIPNFFFNADDPCSDYSISKPIEVEIDCPDCTEPLNITILSNPGSSVVSGIKTVSLCSGDQLKLNSNDITPVGGYSNYQIRWYKGNKSTAVGTLEPSGTQARELSITHSNTGSTVITTKYYVQAIDADFPGVTNCHKWDSILVIENPVPHVNYVPGQSLCSGTSSTPVTLSSSPSGSSYSWSTVASANITGLSPATSSGTSATIPGVTLSTNNGALGTVTYTVRPTLNGCPGPDSSYVVRVKPLPSVSNTFPSSPYCPKEATPSVVLSSNPSGATYSWTTTVSGVSGLAASTGTGNIPSETSLEATGTTPGTVTYTITPSLDGCNGTPVTYTVTVKPLPHVSPLTDQSICSGTASPSVALSSSPSGSTYSWTTSVSGVSGLATSTGTGNLPSETSLQTTGSTPGTITYTITPSLDGCTGPDSTYILTVKPLPHVSPLTDQSICSGTASPSVALSSNPSGSTYSWTTSVSGVSGLATSTGTGNLPSETSLRTTGSTPGTITYTITPSLDGCTGPDSTYVLTVKPVPQVLPVSDESICSGSSSTPVSLSSTLSGTTFSWTAIPSANVTGLVGTSGTTSQVNSETLSVNNGSPGTVTYTIKPTLDGCSGSDSMYTITINPLPTQTLTDPQPFCSGELASEPVKTLSGFTITWYTGADGLTPATEPSVQSQPWSATPHLFYYKVTDASTGCTSAVNTYTVSVDSTTAPTVIGSITYLITDTLSNGKFQDLLTQAPGSVTSGAGFELLWYDKDKNLLGPTTPTPGVPTSDQDLTYYVSRRPTSGHPLCESELVEVKVYIYLAPAPATTTIKYCQYAGSHSTDYATDFQDNVTKNTTQGPSSDYDIVWYTDNNPSTVGTSVPTIPSTLTSNPGRVTYYVTQKHKISQAESSRVALHIEIYGVKIPDVSGNTLSYCFNDNSNPLQVNRVEDQPNYYYADGYEWFEEGLPKSLPSVNTGVVGETTFGVLQTYTIVSGNVCKGDTAFFTVRVNRTDVPTGDLTVNYLKSEGTSPNSFANLTTKNPSVAVTTVGCSTCQLVWLNPDGSLSGGTGQTAPVPVIDPSLPSGQDQHITYYVYQRDSHTGCLSDTLEVKVTISDTPMPETRSLSYCENETLTDLRNFTLSNGNPLARINEDVMPASNYKLLWYSQDPKTNPSATALTGAIIPSITIPSGQKKAEIIYYVTQERTDLVDPVTLRGAESSASQVKVTVYARPAFTVIPPSPLCETAIDITGSWTLTNGYTPSEVTKKYYLQSDGSVDEPSPSVISESGVRYIQLGYDLPSSQAYSELTCYSPIQPVTIGIDSLSVPQVTVAPTTCPGTQITLDASATANGTISYSWNSTDIIGTPSLAGNSRFVTSPVSHTVGDTYKFKVTATSGTCTKESATYTVEVGDGPVIGTMTISETDNNDSPKTYGPNDPKQFYSCGINPVTLHVDYVTTDEGSFIWKENGTTAVQTGRSLTVTPDGSPSKTYVLEFENKCPTKVSVTIHFVPLEVTSNQPRMQLCEGEEFTASLTILQNDPEGLLSSIVWYQDGTLLAGETGTTYHIGNVQPVHSGIYTYRVSRRGCTVSGQIEGLDVEGHTGATQLDISGKVTVGLLPEETLCSGEPTLSTGLSWVQPASSHVIWDADATIETISSDGLQITARPPYISSESYRSSYPYRLKVINVYCGMDTIVTVQVDKPLSGSITGEGEICEGQSVTLDAGSYEGQQYIWSSDSYTGNKNGPSQIEHPQTDAHYHVRIIRGSCEAEDNHTIKVNSRPLIQGIDSVSTRDRLIVADFSYGTPPFDYGVDQELPDSDPLKRNLRFGTHHFYIRDALGCLSDTYGYVVDAPKIYPPPYFTPDGDGVNDVWDVVNLREVYPQSVVVIFDRYGKKLSEYMGSASGWDGTYLGNNMPSTDYWYEINIEEIDKIYVGHFTLIRSGR